MAVVTAVWQAQEGSGSQGNISAQSPGRPCRRKGVSEPLNTSARPEEAGPPTPSLPLLWGHAILQESILGAAPPMVLRSGSFWFCVCTCGFPMSPPQSTGRIPASAEVPAVLPPSEAPSVSGQSVAVTITCLLCSHPLPRLRYPHGCAWCTAMNMDFWVKSPVDVGSTLP